MPEKEDLHRLIDMLPQAESPLASRFLQSLAESSDDTPLTEADLEAVREGELEIARGDLVTLEDFKHELGL